jgi:hypothetical protein
MVQRLPEDAEFSHYRVLAEAFETLGDASGITALSSLLERPGVSGHHLHNTQDRRNTITTDWTETSFRNASLIELHLAAALYALDSGNALAGKILRAYAADVRHVFASYAENLLKKTI